MSETIFYVQTVIGLVRQRGCSSSSEPSLVAYVISTIFTRAGSFTFIATTILFAVDEVSPNTSN